MTEFEDLPIVRNHRVKPHPAGVQIFHEDKEDWFYIVQVLPDGSVAGITKTHPSWAGETNKAERFPAAKNELVAKSRADYKRMVQIAKDAHVAGYIRVSGW